VITRSGSSAEIRILLFLFFQMAALCRDAGTPQLQIALNN
jgi:hypothetical protein